MEEKKEIPELEKYYAIEEAIKRVEESYGQFDNYKVLAKGTIEGAYPAADPDKLGNLTYDYYADGAVLADGSKAKKQNYIGYYTQVAAGTTLDGEFYIPGTTFHEPEDAE